MPAEAVASAFGLLLDRCLVVALERGLAGPTAPTRPCARSSPLDLVAQVLAATSRPRAPARRPGCAPRPARGTSCPPRRAPRRRRTMRLISSSVRPLEALMTIFCSLPVALSLADTLQDAVGVDVEGDLDLRHAARRRRDVGQVEPAQRLVVARRARARPAARGWSPRSGCRRRSRTPVDALVGIVVFFSMSLVITPPSVSMPSDSGVTSSSSTSLTSPDEHAGLDRGADGHGLVRIHVLARLLAEEVLHGLLHQRHARLAADQDHLGDVAAVEARHP